MVKHGLEHTWDGFKLLATNTRVTWGILKKMRRGEVLSRREQSLLMLTTADLVRIVCCAAREWFVFSFINDRNGFSTTK
jgi:hypothetical protein